MRYSVKRENCYVADFETITGETDYFKKHQDTGVLLACSTDLATETAHLFSNITEWFNFHVNQMKNQVVYFHNLSFDSSFLLPYLIKQGFKPTLNTRLKECQHKTFSYFANGSRVFEVCCFFRTNKKRWFVRFNCSYRILTLSVDKLGKAVGIDKKHEGEGSEFYNVEPEDSVFKYPKRFVEYIENDCKIVRRSLNIFEKGLKELNAVKIDTALRLSNGDKPRDLLNNLTITQITLKLMKMYTFQYIRRSKFPNNTRMITNNANNNEKASKFIGGGLTQFNPIYEKENNVMHNCVYLDINSAYPFAMTQLLPYGDELDEPPIGDYIAAHYIDIKKATIKKGCEGFAVLKNPNPRRNDKVRERYVLEAKDFRTYQFDCAWQALQRVYDFKIRHIKTVYFKAAPFLKDYATELFEKRLEYKQNKNPLEQPMKTLMNAGYGGLLMKTDYPDWLVLDNQTAQELLEQAQSNPMELFEYENRLYKYCYESTIHDNPYFKVISAIRMDKKQKLWGFNRWAGAYIPAFVRSLIINRVMDEGVEHFVYCDTDSIIFNNLSDERYQYHINNHSMKLGDFKLEKILKQFSCYGAKRYYAIDIDGKEINRFAGVSETASSYSEIRKTLSFDEEYITIKDAVFGRQRCPSGLVLIKVDKTFKKGSR